MLNGLEDGVAFSTAIVDGSTRVSKLTAPLLLFKIWFKVWEFASNIVFDCRSVDPGICFQRDEFQNDEAETSFRRFRFCFNY
jgi:hypothetical protein